MDKSRSIDCEIKCKKTIDKKIKNNYRTFYLICIMVTMLFSNPSMQKSDRLYADERNPYGQHWHCIRAIKYYEKKYNLPSNLLYTIATVESGYNDIGGKDPLPWPWTINALGKSHYLKNPKEALSLLKKLLAAGHTNIDIGCAQINWASHKHHFGGDPKNILNPVYNVAYAAHYLTERYNKQKNWQGAVGAYHSSTPYLGSAYASKVFKKLKHIININGYNQYYPQSLQKIRSSPIKAKIELAEIYGARRYKTLKRDAFVGNKMPNRTINRLISLPPNSMLKQKNKTSGLKSPAEAISSPMLFANVNTEKSAKKMHNILPSN